MQNISQNAHKDDGKAHLPKEKGGAMQRGAMKPSLNAKTETSRLMDVSHNFSVAVPVSESNGFTSAKNRKVEVSSTLSDGSRSKISALDPSFAKGTYSLTKQGTDVSEKKYNKAGHQQKHQGLQDRLNSSGAADADADHDIDVYMNLDPSEQTDVLINTQVL